MLAKLKTALVLVIIGGFSGLAIWATNEATYETIIENARIKEENFYKEIFDLDSDFEIESEKTDTDGLINQEVTIKNKNTQEVIGIIYRGYEKNSYGDMTVLVGIDLDGNISKVIISDTSNTPNYVKKLTKSTDTVPSYIDHFANQSYDDFTIDSSTGASYSYGSVSKIVEAATNTYGGAQ